MTETIKFQTNDPVTHTTNRLSENLHFSTPTLGCDTISKADQNRNLYPFQGNHQLDHPEIVPDQEKNIKEILNEFKNIIPKDTQEEGARSSKEVALWLLYFACMKEQQESREEDSKLAMLITKQIQKENQTIQKEHFNILDAKISRSKASRILNWISWGLWGAIAASGAAGVAFTVAMGLPAALPTVVASFQAAAQIGQGSTQIARAILNYKNDLKTGEIKQLEMKRTINSEYIQDQLKRTEQAVQEIADILEKMIEIADNQYTASKNLR